METKQKIRKYACQIQREFNQLYSHSTKFRNANEITAYLDKKYECIDPENLGVCDGN